MKRKHQRQLLAWAILACYYGRSLNPVPALRLVIAWPRAEQPHPIAIRIQEAA